MLGEQVKEQDSEGKDWEAMQVALPCIDWRMACTTSSCARKEVLARLSLLCVSSRALLNDHT